MHGKAITLDKDQWMISKSKNLIFHALSWSDWAKVFSPRIMHQYHRTQLCSPNDENKNLLWSMLIRLDSSLTHFCGESWWFWNYENENLSGGVVSRQIICWPMLMYVLAHRQNNLTLSELWRIYSFESCNTLFTHENDNTQVRCICWTERVYSNSTVLNLKISSRSRLPSIINENSKTFIKFTSWPTYVMRIFTLYDS